MPRGHKTLSPAAPVTARSARRESEIDRLLTSLLGALLAMLTVANSAFAQDHSFPKYIFYCTGTLSSQAGQGARAVDRKANTSVMIELEAERLVLIGSEATAVLPFLRVEETPVRTIYHFGGIAGDMVYKGTFTIPEFGLRVVGAGERLEIEIAMNCDGSEPLRLY